jgi:tetratricopeptide (TPR) repeat protein
MPAEPAATGHALSRAECPSFRLVRGRPLADAVAEYRRSPSSLGLHDLLRRFVAACYEMAYAHSRGALHLGLTPRLILLGEYGETAVVGWDRACPTSATNGEAVAGTVGPDAFAAAFLAPEQAFGRAEGIGPASDVYALGAVLYFILSGEPPHAGSAAEVLSRVREGLPWQPRMVAAGVPAALEAVCLTAMERDPAERYPSAANLAREVERWTAGEQVRTNYMEPKGVRLMRWARGRYGLLTFAGLLLASLGTTVVAINVIRVERRYAREDNQRLGEVIREKAAEINRQRGLTSEEFAAAIQTLRNLALLAQGRPGSDPALAAFKAEVLRRVYDGARQMAARADQAGATDLAAANDRLSLGELFVALGRFDEARQQYEHAVLITRNVANALPDSLPARNGLFLAARNLAQVQLILREPTAARMAARTALAAAEERAKADPNNVQLRRDVAGCYELIAEASIALHDLPAAREAFDRMLAAVESYAKPDSPNLLDRSGLAGAYFARSRVERLDHRYKDALLWYDRALAILRPLKAEGRLNPPSLALVDQLEKAAEECRTVLKAVDDINVALGEPTEKALRLLTERAAVLARLERTGNAVTTAEKMRELKPQDGANLYNVACTYALCASAVGAGKPADALTAEEKAARADYITRAVKELRAAADHGFRDVAHIEADPDLDALHQEAGYRSLVAELKAVPAWLTFPVLP